MTHELRLTYDDHVWAKMEKAREKADKKQGKIRSWASYISELMGVNENDKA